MYVGLVIQIIMKNIKNIMDEIDFINLLENLKSKLYNDNLHKIKIKNNDTNRSMKGIELIDKFRVLTSVEELDIYLKNLSLTNTFQYSFIIKH